MIRFKTRKAKKEYHDASSALMVFNNLKERSVVERIDYLRRQYHMVTKGLLSYDSYSFLSNTILSWK